MAKRGPDGKFVRSHPRDSSSCLWCGKAFESYSRTQRYCSHSCAMYAQHRTARRTGRPFVDPAKRRAAAWKGGRNQMASGYIRVWVNGVGYRYEHRLVMEKVLRRRLRPDEAVHHLDGDRANNAPANLVLLSKDAHDRASTLARLRSGWRPTGRPGPRVGRVVVVCRYCGRENSCRPSRARPFCGIACYRAYRLAR